MNRRGFVLAAAILVIVLVAALVAGVFFAMMEETRIARTASSGEAALITAESAIEAVIASWGDRAGQAVGVSGEAFSTFSNGTISAAVTVTRLDSTLYSIVAKAGAARLDGAATRCVGAVVSVRNAVDRAILVDPIPERWWSECF